MILPLTSPDLRLDNAGGKAVNLARLTRLGYPVPAGFLITTQAYLDFVQLNQLEGYLTASLDGIKWDDPTALQAVSEDIRGRFTEEKLDGEFVESLGEAYLALGSPAVAVRSSATAEDLPELSFAGQQDTYLNILGQEALARAVVSCWGSLWTARAIGYRKRNGLGQSGLALAVIVQQMVHSQVSGVLFTANPLSGLRDELVIDAALGLGEALVSGQVEPDHYTVTRRGDRVQIKEKGIGSKTLAIRGKAGGGVEKIMGEASQIQALPDGAILELARLGSRVAEDYGFPQDIEWTWTDQVFSLVQTRPITSLYPLPENLPAEPLRVMLSFGAVQGMLDPLTLLAGESIMAMFVGVSRIFGYRFTLREQQGLFWAGERLWINFTRLLRNRIGRRLAGGILSFIEPGSKAGLLDFLDDPRLAPDKAGPPVKPGTALRLLLRVLLPTAGRFIRTLTFPDRTRNKVIREVEEYLSYFSTSSRNAISLAALLSIMQEAFDRIPLFMFRRMIPMFAPGMAMLNLLNKLSHGIPGGSELVLEITRGLPYNVTTEMDLSLWETAQKIRGDEAALKYFQQHPATELSIAYQSGGLPETAQGAIRQFLDIYGLRGVGEIDIGRLRWQDDPTPVIQTILSYLQINQLEAAPDAVFERSRIRALQAIDELVAQIRLQQHGGVKAYLARIAAGRVRAVTGMREMPKFFVVRVIGFFRMGLLKCGESLVAAGLMDEADGLFFLRLDELNQLAGWQNAEGTLQTDERVGKFSPSGLKELVRTRRQRYQRELLRRQVPRLLLSDGRAYYGSAPQAEGEDVIHGSPVSPGVVEGRVHVVLNPYGVQLAPGEILVCPGTDPAWTPLFLAAGGLVMEVGGMMTHGSVVAREYGIPAVVGVHQATTRLKNGQVIRVDGTKGEITLVASIEVEGGD